jgi:hypothetical protein
MEPDEFELVTMEIPRFFLEDLELTAWDEAEDYVERGLEKRGAAMGILAEQAQRLRNADA